MQNIETKITAHEVIIAPGGTVTVHCKHGKTSFDVLKTEVLLNFGGDLKIIDCNAEETYVIL